MMTKIPVPGVVWQTLQYLVGFERLGFETYYVEAHARTPSSFMVGPEDASGQAARFLADTLGRFGFAGRWAFHALHSDGRCYGMHEGDLRRLYRTAALLVNLHGGTIPLPEHSATGRLVMVETDPVTTQVELHDGNCTTDEFLRSHAALFTYAESYGTSGCALPVSESFDFRPTRQPIVLDFWGDGSPPVGATFTTIANWRQRWRSVWLEGEEYLWSKHHEFLRFLDLPRRTGQHFELALSGYEDQDRRLLEDNGWRVRSALELTLDSYRAYIGASRAEFTVAKDQNIRLQTGWFSDRSAAYLASGRAVITQETGFSDHLPTGYGLLAYCDIDELEAAVDRVAADPGWHGRAAREVAIDHFRHDVVLGAIVESVGLQVAGRPIGGGATRSRQSPYPDDLDLQPMRRNPTTLKPETVRAVLDRPVEPPGGIRGTSRPDCSVVVPTHDNLVISRLCVESLLAGQDVEAGEVIVVDNGSSDGTVEWLDRLAAADSRLRVVANRENRGFAAGVNQGVAVAAADTVVILNDDTIPAPGWRRALTRHLGADGVGMVGPLTNRGGGASVTPVSYRTYGEMLRAASALVASRRGAWQTVAVLNMFCVALRRHVVDLIGPLDEGFGLGLFEDDDYAWRLRAAGFELRRVEDAFVHHFGRATFDRLVVGGEYQRLWNANRRRFEQKWGRPWTPAQGAPDRPYAQMIERLHRLILKVIEPGCAVVVVSRGDDKLVSLGPKHLGRHFPCGADGRYAGHYPADSAEAVGLLQTARDQGAAYLVVPATSAWWLEHYPGLEDHLGRQAVQVADEPGTGVVYRLQPHAAAAGSGGQR
jgi:GT2 family glycosyltransferase